MGERGLSSKPATGSQTVHKRRRSNALEWAEQRGRTFGSALAGRQPQEGKGPSRDGFQLSTGKVLRRVPALRERHITFLRSGLPGVEGGVASNAANPGWLGLQNIRSRHAEQTGEVVRNHEVGTCRTCGSELPRVIFARRWSGVDARRCCRRRGTRERIPREASQRELIQRSRGALKERPSPRRQHPPIFIDWNRVL
jgi:hypothetical protein